RPKEVKDWVSRAGNHTPKITDPTAFGTTWWGWWVDINPEWRGSTRPMKCGEGPWDCMNIHGQKGSLNILMALRWWRDAMSSTSPDWETAIDDVTWALHKMQK
ncbi:hypothetical protein K438DRAFT_1473403, partial [Mycena galopus ATCC 62051]